VRSIPFASQAALRAHVFLAQPITLAAVEQWRLLKVVEKGESFRLVVCRLDQHAVPSVASADDAIGSEGDAWRLAPIRELRHEA
jgi:hypothetical protein